MILSRNDIIKRIQRKKSPLAIDPFDLKDVDQVSIDLHLGDKFTTFKTLPRHIDSIYVDASVWESEDLWNHQTLDTFVLNPGEFVLAQTWERIFIPGDLVGLVEGRSSWARLGISIHITAPKIDPGFNGKITLEMYNFGKAKVRLRAREDKPAQLMLLSLSKPLKSQELYGTGSEDYFQGQSTPIPSKKRSH